MNNIYARKAEIVIFPIRINKSKIRKIPFKRIDIGIDIEYRLDEAAEAFFKTSI